MSLARSLGKRDLLRVVGTSLPNCRATNKKGPCSFLPANCWQKRFFLLVFPWIHFQYLLGSYSGLPSAWIAQHLRCSPAGYSFSVGSTKPWYLPLLHTFLFPKILRPTAGTLSEPLSSVSNEPSSQRSKKATTGATTACNTENQLQEGLKFDENPFLENPLCYG